MCWASDTLALALFIELVIVLAALVLELVDLPHHKVGTELR